MRPRPFTREQVAREVRASAWVFDRALRTAARGNVTYRRDADKLRRLAHRPAVTENPAQEMAWAILYRAAYLGTLPTLDQAAAWRRNPEA